MMESIRIVQKCNHTKKIYTDEDCSVDIYRNEVRNSVKLLANSSKLSYHGQWQTDVDSEGKVVSKTNSNNEARLAVFFYGDDITIFAKAENFAGDVYVYLDGELVDEVSAANNIQQDNTFPIAAFEGLQYKAHKVELSFTTEFRPASFKASNNPTLSITGVYFSQILIDDIEDYDIISEREVIKKVTDVYQAYEDGECDARYFIEGTDYQFFGGNKIRWIGLNRPKPHIPYTVEYIKTNISLKTFIQTECEKCYGAGWYGSLQNLDTSQPSRTTGVEKIAEDIIKFILTPYNSEIGYGSEFLDLMKNNYINVEDVESYAVSEIERIEEAYRTIQNNEIVNGATYEDSDRLANIVVEKVDFDMLNLRLGLIITVHSMAGSEVTVQENFEL